MEIEIEYDDEIMHGDDSEATAWFRQQVLENVDTLILHSNEIGDSIGVVKSAKVSVSDRLLCEMTENRESCEIRYHETPPDDLKPGDFWCDDELHDGEDHPAMFLYMILPDGSNIGGLHVYRGNRPESSPGPCWKITGHPRTPTTLSLSPSVHLRGKWHGYLENGLLRSC